MRISKGIRKRVVVRNGYYLFKTYDSFLKTWFFAFIYWNKVTILNARIQRRLFNKRKMNENGNKSE
jgi:hypothetical protein